MSAKKKQLDLSGLPLTAQQVFEGRPNVAQVHEIWQEALRKLSDARQKVIELERQLIWISYSYERGNVHPDSASYELDDDRSAQLAEARRVAVTAQIQVDLARHLFQLAATGRVSLYLGEDE